MKNEILNEIVRGVACDMTYYFVNCLNIKNIISEILITKEKLQNFVVMGELLLGSTSSSFNLFFNEKKTEKYT